MFSEWISVEKEMPLIYQRVLVTFRDIHGHVQIDVAEWESGKWWETLENTKPIYPMANTITHWMPLPSLLEHAKYV